MNMLIFGHRCTIVSQADGVELDVVITRDKALVVNHDPVDSTAAELPYPRLREVLELDLPESYWFDIESKNSPPDLLAGVVREYIGRRRMIVRSFDHAFLRAFHALEPEIPLAALIEYDADDWPAVARAAKAQIISPLYTTITAERIAQAHAAGLEVSAWTPNTEAEWIRLAVIGVDTIITDRPAAACQALR